MKRKIVRIDQSKCTGCGACASACHEEAIAIIHGKAQLIRDDYCDGLGNCLPHCPADAITIEERETVPYDETAVSAHKQEHVPAAVPAVSQSSLQQWPVQIKLVPAHAPYFNGAHLLIAADCTAYAYARFHNDFMKNRITLIGCPKLDDIDYSEKLTEIIRSNSVKSITVARMEVPCCGGLAKAVQKALQQSGKHPSCQYVTISLDGKIVKTE